MATILDADAIDQALSGLAAQIAEHAPSGASVGIIGIRRRGEILARRLIDKLASADLGTIEYGALDITLYRDDLAEIGAAAVVRGTDIPFDINGMYIVLVDDVLHTGRTVRSALTALSDLGRPVAVRLAVLVERPGRELPLQADFVGARVQRADQRVDVQLEESDGCDLVEAS
jgi:pyrimidine operon attenuation protein/uracil phosphoribosyltransferase